MRLSSYCETAVTIRVLYHHEAAGWWAESPDVDGWTVAGDTFEQVRELVDGGVRFALAAAAEEGGDTFDERRFTDVAIEHYVPAPAGPARTALFPRREDPVLGIHDLARLTRDSRVRPRPTFGLTVNPAFIRSSLRAMRIRLLVCVALAPVAAAVAANASDDKPVRTAAPARSAASCPMKLLSLGANPIGPASRAALRAERPVDRPQIRDAAIASLNFDRSPQVTHNCGRRIAARSIVVTILRRAYQSGPKQSASLSQGVVVVGRFRSGWRVWDVLH